MWIFALIAALILIAYVKEHKALSEANERIKKFGDIDEYTNKKKEEAFDAAKKREAEAVEFVAQQKVEADKYNEKTKKLKKTLRELEEKYENLKKDEESLELEILVGMVKIDAYENLKSDEIKNKLTMLQGRQDQSVKNGEAVKTGIREYDYNKRELDSQKKQILRCFNAECSNIIGGVTVKNVDASRAKIQRAYDAVNKIFAIDSVQITQEYLAMKYEELSLVYAYMLKQEEEKEQRKAIREQMVEEEKTRREIEREKQKIEKEENQFTNEVKKLMSYMQKSKDDVERQLYIDKIQELEDKLKALAADKENVLEREQNTRAGFVYIISNIGSFGENVYKIGMTRRLDPMDRISELSSASVPFPFDVHALIFSEDAPGLENVLHQYFTEKRVNLVNQRKEFFRVDLEDIKRVVVENHNATVKFVDVPDAEEYRETLRLQNSD